jgi:hypothetical protein
LEPTEYAYSSQPTRNPFRYARALWRLVLRDPATTSSGKRTEPLFGVDWNELWSVPITDLRERFGIDRTAIVGERIRAAA